MTLEEKHKKKARHFCRGSEILMSVLNAPNQRLFIHPKKEEINLEKEEDHSVEAKNITALLESIGYSQIDLKNGLATRDGKNFLKIGKILQRNDCRRLLKSWRQLTDNSPSKRKGAVLCISLNPVDILSASYGRSWISCLAPGDVGYPNLSRNLLSENRFALVAYEVLSEDTEVKRPKGRVFLHAFGRRQKTPTRRIKIPGTHLYCSERLPKKKPKVYLFEKDTVYGSFSSDVSAELNRFLYDLNKEVYKKGEPLDFLGYYNNSIYHNLDGPKPFKKTKKRSGSGKIDSIIAGTAKKKVKRFKIGFRWGERYQSRINAGPALIEDLVDGKRVARNRISNDFPNLSLYQLANLMKTKAGESKALKAHFKQKKISQEKSLVLGLTKPKI